LPGTDAKDALLREAKPDVVIDFQRRDAFEHVKRGYQPQITSDLFRLGATTYWGYDGFSLFTADLDRAVNAPWRRLLQSPWKREVPSSASRINGRIKLQIHKTDSHNGLLKK